jgi:hypothetical protein
MAARRELRERLAAGKIKALILCSVHGPTPLEPKWWVADEAKDALRSGEASLVISVVPLGSMFLPVQASGPVGVAIDEVAAKSAVNAERQCMVWLATAVARRTHRTKLGYRKAAIAEIPRLSGASFARAWARIADEPGNGWMTLARSEAAQAQGLMAASSPPFYIAQLFE